MAHPLHARLVNDGARQSPVPADVVAVLLRLPAAMHVTGLSRSTLYRLIADKRFPRPVRLGPRAVAWLRSEVDAWSEACPVTKH
jgi:prophage regulatory protein